MFLQVFSKTTCGYCEAAKRTLSQETHRLKTAGCTVPGAAVIELDDGSLPTEVAKEVQVVLQRMTGEATVPRVFVDKVLIGGATETVAYARSGALRMALMKIGRCVFTDSSLDNNEDSK